MNAQKNIGVIGGGPAGLMAAETATAHGAHVTLYDAMPSVGRKFLVAGKSGLNLTFDEPLEPFLSRYQGPEMPHALWHKIISEFDNTALRKWAESLGIQTFTSRSGKVFPEPINGVIRAAPLLRRWISRLRESGVCFKTRHRLTHIHPGVELQLACPEGNTTAHHDAVILALGGGSWSSTGSDGKWAHMLRSLGINVSPLQPANCGWETPWPEELLSEAEGLPIKNLRIHAGETSCRGELVITRYGLEGAPVYRLGPALRSTPKPSITIDFKPEMSLQEVIERLGNIRKNYIREARRRLKLDAATCALLKHLPHLGPWSSTHQLAKAIKQCHIPLTKPRPLDEAISSAGGVCWSGLTDTLMITSLPGIFVAGEMIDWEAPTGGYLMQACFATGKWTGMHAATSST